MAKGLFMKRMAFVHAVLVIVLVGIVITLCGNVAAQTITVTTAPSVQYVRPVYVAPTVVRTPLVYVQVPVVSQRIVQRPLVVTPVVTVEPRLYRGAQVVVSPRRSTISVIVR